MSFLEINFSINYILNGLQIVIIIITFGSQVNNLIARLTVGK